MEKFVCVYLLRFFFVFFERVSFHIFVVQYQKGLKFSCVKFVYTFKSLLFGKKKIVIRKRLHFLKKKMASSAIHICSFCCKIKKMFIQWSRLLTGELVEKKKRLRVLIRWSMVCCFLCTISGKRRPFFLLFVSYFVCTFLFIFYHFFKEFLKVWGKCMRL